MVVRLAARAMCILVLCMCVCVKYVTESLKDDDGHTRQTIIVSVILRDVD